MTDNDKTDLSDTEQHHRGKSVGWIALAVLVGLILVIVAFSIGNTMKSNDTSSASPTTSTTSPSTSATTTPPAKKAVVEGLGELDLVEGGDDIRGDSTGLPETPPVLSDELREKCGVLVNWKSLFDCANTHNLQWYIDGVNRFAPNTGFNWNDVARWAEVGPDDARFILVANWPGKDDQQARKDVEGLVGSDAAKKLPIVRHDCIVNTRGLKEHELSPFADCKRQVRVSLAPLVFKDGKLSGWRGNAGVFVDCYNLWWLAKIEKSVPPPPATGTGTPPVSTPPRTTTPCAPNNCVPTTTTTPPTTTTSTPPPCEGPCLPPKTPDGPPEAPGHTNVGPPPGPPEVSIPPEPNPMNPRVPTSAPAPPTIKAPAVIAPDPDLNTSAPPVMPANPVPSAPADTDVTPVG